VFAESEENVVFWTLRGRSAAAATSSVNLARLERLHPGSLRVLWRSPPIPRHVVAVPRDLDPSLAGALERGLLTMDQDEAGRAALQAFEGTTRFDRFPRGADADLQTVRECIEILGAEAAR
jgi:ABC-type phosphate/phosphonate transport system substrate-binding protein